MSQDGSVNITAEKEKIKLGGGQKALEKQKDKGKIAARERINLLLDNPKDFYELSTFAAYEMYKDTVNGDMTHFDDEMLQRGNSGIPLCFGDIYFRKEWNPNNEKNEIYC